MSSFIQVHTTVASREEADQLAAALVERRLAGCVQIVGPIASVYRWQGPIDTSQEWLLIIKTSLERFAALEEAIRELHGYETPEIVATPIVALSAAYADWLTKTLGDEPC